MAEMTVFMKSEVNGNTQRKIIWILVALVISMTGYSWSILSKDVGFLKEAQARTVYLEQYRIDCTKAEKERNKNTERIETIQKEINSALKEILNQVGEIRIKVATIEGRK